MGERGREREGDWKEGCVFVWVVVAAAVGVAAVGCAYILGRFIG